MAWIETSQSAWSEWRRPLVAVLLTFLCNVQSSMLAMGEWPYMSTIDHDATASFYGYATAANKAGHVVFAFLFAAWAHKIAAIRLPMLVGCGITMLGSIMYIFVEFIPTNRRWWMLVCYVLFGAGFGTSPLLRSYIARVTTEEHRSTAYALQNTALVVSVVVGPLAQIAFVGLPYPGVAIIAPNINLNIFTAPIWFAIITNITAIIIIVLLLKDTKQDEDANTDKAFNFSLSSIKEQLGRVRTMNLPWLLIALVLFEKLISGLFNATMLAIAGPMMSVMYALSGSDTAVVLGIAQIVVGVLALGLSLAFFFFKLGPKVSCRVLFAFSNVIVVAAYIITYPYPFSSTPMQPFNGKNNKNRMRSTRLFVVRHAVVNIIPFLICLIVMSSFAIPSAGLSLDTIYSKMIGNIDQNVMQALFVIADDITAIFGPIYGSAIFTAIGANFLNIINGSLYIAATVFWLAAWKWLEPYK